MPVYTKNSTHFKSPVFVHVCSIGNNIPTSIVVGVPDVSNLTGKYLTIAGTVFNLNCLSRYDCSVYELFNAHVLNH